MGREQRKDEGAHSSISPLWRVEETPPPLFGNLRGDKERRQGREIRSIVFSPEVSKSRQLKNAEVRGRTVETFNVHLKPNFERYRRELVCR